MARRLVWSPEAVEDIERIASYIERDSVHYARAVASRIVALADSISDFPDMGRVVPEINDPSYRERFVHKYRIIYHLKDARILIVAVIHGHRMLESHVPRIKDA